MPKLPLDRLTIPEQGVLSRYQQEITLLQNLLAVKQRAYTDIVGLALEARGLSPDTHEVTLDGRVLPKGKLEAAEVGG